MKVLLDEAVPQPLVSIVRHLLRGHSVQHVRDMKWSGKKDVPLIADARNAGFDVIVTNDMNQLNDPVETAAIRKSRIHHVRYDQPDGLAGLGLASGAICAAIRKVIEELEAATGQRLIHIQSLRNDKRFTVVDPQRDSPTYWK